MKSIARRILSRPDWSAAMMFDYSGVLSNIFTVAVTGNRRPTAIGPLSAPTLSKIIAQSALSCNNWIDHKAFDMVSILEPEFQVRPLPPGAVAPPPAQGAGGVTTVRVVTNDARASLRQANPVVQDFIAELNGDNEHTVDLGLLILSRVVNAGAPVERVLVYHPSALMADWFSLGSFASQFVPDFTKLIPEVQAYAGKWIDEQIQAMPDLLGPLRCPSPTGEDAGNIAKILGEMSRHLLTRANAPVPDTSRSAMFDLKESLMGTERSLRTIIENVIGGIGVPLRCQGPMLFFSIWRAFIKKVESQVVRNATEKFMSSWSRFMTKIDSAATADGLTQLHPLFQVIVDMVAGSTVESLFGTLNAYMFPVNQSKVKGTSLNGAAILRGLVHYLRAAAVALDREMASSWGGDEAKVSPIGFASKCRDVSKVAERSQALAKWLRWSTILSGASSIRQNGADFMFCDGVGYSADSKNLVLGLTPSLSYSNQRREAAEELAADDFNAPKTKVVLNEATTVSTLVRSGFPGSAGTMSVAWRQSKRYMQFSIGVVEGYYTSADQIPELRGIIHTSQWMGEPHSRDLTSASIERSPAYSYAMVVFRAFFERGAAVSFVSIENAVSSSASTGHQLIIDRGWRREVPEHKLPDQSECYPSFPLALKPEAIKTAMSDSADPVKAMDLKGIYTTDWDAFMVSDSSKGSKSSLMVPEGIAKAEPFKQLYKCTLLSESVWLEGQFKTRVPFISTRSSEFCFFSEDYNQTVSVSQAGSLIYDPTVSDIPCPSSNGAAVEACVSLFVQHDDGRSMPIETEVKIPG